MQIKLENLTARAIAGMLYSGKLQATQVYQILEEKGLDAKLERVTDLLQDMEATDDYYKLNAR